MIIVKLISGLGNQLFQYALGRRLALAKNTALKLDVSFYGSQDLRSYALDRYNIKAAIATPADIDRVMGVYHHSSLAARTYRRLERYVPKHHRRYYREETWWAYDPFLHDAFGKTYLEGYWQHFRYYNDLDPRIFDELTLLDTASLESQPVYQAVRDDAASVSLHIRRGDYVTDIRANQLMGVMPLSYYAEATRHILLRHPNASFYVFSDDLNWARDNLVIGAPVTYVDIANGTQDHIELAIMSACRHNIIANSTFSWWGAFLNRNPNKIVVAPFEWVAQEDVNRHIKVQMPGWIKL